MHFRIRWIAIQFTVTSSKRRLVPSQAANYIKIDLDRCKTTLSRKKVQFVIQWVFRHKITSSHCSHALSIEKWSSAFNQLLSRIWITTTFGEVQCVAGPKSTYKNSPPHLCSCSVFHRMYSFILHVSKEMGLLWQYPTRLGPWKSAQLSLAAKPPAKRICSRFSMKGRLPCRNLFLI